MDNNDDILRDLVLKMQQKGDVRKQVYEEDPQITRKWNKILPDINPYTPIALDNEIDKARIETLKEDQNKDKSLNPITQEERDSYEAELKKQLEDGKYGSMHRGDLEYYERPDHRDIEDPGILENTRDVVYDRTFNKNPQMKKEKPVAFPFIGQPMRLKNTPTESLNLNPEQNPEKDQESIDRLWGKPQGDAFAQQENAIRNPNLTDEQREQIGNNLKKLLIRK